MRFGGILGQTVAGSVILAAISAAGGLVLARPAIGFGVAVGLLLGAFNGHALTALLDRNVPFVGASLVRIATLSAIGILAAVLVGAAPWAVLLGVAGAQVVMTIIAARQGLRA